MHANTRVLVATLLTVCSVLTCRGQTMPSHTTYQFPLKPYNKQTAAKYPLEATTVDRQVAAILQSGKDMPLKPTGATYELYLDLAERLVRVAATWQNDQGVSIDPVENREFNQSSPRFVASAAVLLHFGRIADLKEIVYRGMDYCCAKLASGKAQSPDFWMRELMTAYMYMPDAPAQRRAKWAADIRAVIPEKIYWNVEKKDKPIKNLHNWTIYAAGGEALRQLANMGPPNDGDDVIWGARFFEKYMPWQLEHFSADGMYRDPDDPFTYDMTTRLQIATPLAYGYQSPLGNVYQELLRRGGLSQLLYVSPEGLSPFGGRSNQMQLQEAILAALGELEARRYQASDPVLAGAFKRQARLSALSLKPWIMDMTPFRHVKNGFDPKTRYGCDSYAGYSVYTLFTSSCLGLAALYADDTIAESLTPAEIGGYVTEFKPAFHKIFANAGGMHIEIDTQADPHYDSTGLGRIMRIGLRPELGLALPFTHDTSKVLLPKEAHPQDMAIGPSWKNDQGEWVSLAAMHEGLKSKLKVQETSHEKVAFSLNWSHRASGVEITENYALSAGFLRYSAQVMISGKPASHVRLSIPMIETDGIATSITSTAPGKAAVVYRKGVYDVQFNPEIQHLFGAPVANRNGIYKPLILEFSGDTAEATLNLREE